MAVNFVKFERGTSTVYNRRKNNHSLDENTLYFIYDKTQPENGGLLYLGYTLIGGTGPQANIASLNDLNDVDLTVAQELAGGMLLRFSSIHQKWEPVSISQALQDANIDFNGNGNGTTVESSELQEGETISNALIRIIETPNEGDIAIISGQPFVYNGTSWISLTNSILENKVSRLESDVLEIKQNLQTIDGRITSLNTTIANIDHLSYVVLEDGQTTNDIDLNASGANKKVYLVPNPEADEHSNDKYHEFMIVNGQLEKLGTWTVNLADYITNNQLNDRLSNYITSNQLNDYVTKTTFNTTIGDLNALAAKLEKEDIVVADSLEEIYAILTWTNIVDDSE